MATEWKDKLVEVITSYDSEISDLQKEVRSLGREKSELEAKVFHLAN